VSGWKPVGGAGLNDCSPNCSLSCGSVTQQRSERGGAQAEDGSPGCTAATEIAPLDVMFRHVGTQHDLRVFSVRDNGSQNFEHVPFAFVHGGKGEPRAKVSDIVECVLVWPRSTWVHVVVPKNRNDRSRAELVYKQGFVSTGKYRDDQIANQRYRLKRTGRRGIIPILRPYE
jgi:hypothetical protein